MKIAEPISRVRNVLKSVKENAFITDRFIYSLIIKYGKTLLKREKRMENVFKNSVLFKELPCVELIDVDKVEACCLGIKINCTIKRTKEKLPSMMDMGLGPLIRSVTSLDYSQKVYPTQPETYTNMTHTSGFKYNKKIYYWIIDEYLYIPGIEWEAIRLQAAFDQDVSFLNCSVKPGECVVQQDREMNIPDHLFSEIEQMVIKEILTAAQIPSDGDDDDKNVMR